jgi:hypothetical protein
MQFVSVPAVTNPAGAACAAAVEGVAEAAVLLDEDDPELQAVATKESVNADTAMSSRRLRKSPPR